MSRLKRSLIAIGIGGTIGLVIVGALFGSRLYLHGRIPYGTSIAGINLSFNKYEKALEKVEAAKQNFLSSRINISVEGNTASIPIGDLGVDIFVEKTLSMVEKGDAKETPLLSFYLPKEERALELLITIDEEKILAELDKNLMLSDIAPKPANFYLDENNQLTIKEAEEGLALNKDKFLSDIKNDVKKLELNNIQLELSLAQPELTAAVLETKKGEVEERLAHGFTLLDPIYSDDWNEKLSDHLDWVVFVPNEEAMNIDIKINRENLNKFIDEEISKWLDDPVEPVTMSMDESGKILVDGRGHNGMLIQRELLKEGIELAVATKTKDVPIPVEEITPELNISQELQDLGIKERIGVGHTSFYGSTSNRIHNIKTGTQRFNGALIAPGAVFSFNQTLGPVDGSTGYRKELVIKKEGTIPEYGGGICQVSTTMYRAILFSGLPLVERNPHSYAVSYYSQVLGHGLDATIYIGGSDLKFQNDTDQHIVVQAYVKNDYELYFVFYGTSDGRSVEMDGPYLSGYSSPGPTIYQESADLAPGQKKQVEISHTGFSANWYRYITNANGETTKEFLETRYRAIPAKVLVGPTPIEESI